MATYLARFGFNDIAKTAAVFGLMASAAFSEQLCPDLTDEVQFDPANHASCVAMWADARHPSDGDGTPKPLDVYEVQIGNFFNAFCHRDPELKNANGTTWAQDKWVRDTGPYTARQNAKHEWEGEYNGFHAPVVIWYSPEAVEWLHANRPEDGSVPPDKAAPMPDGTIIAKEMYTPPGSRCRDGDVAKMKPANGIAYMVRDTKTSHDGWFWGYFGFYPSGAHDPNIDWPPMTRGGALPYSGYGQYCLNCHASAEDNSTFSSLRNIKGEPGTPLVFLSQDWFLTEVESDVIEHVPPAPQAEAAPPPPSIPQAFKDIFPLPVGQSIGSIDSFRLPSQTYDNVWVTGTDSPLLSEYVTSDQCLGCHDSGSTGLRYDMTEPNPNPHGPALFNLSPYATWRSSPMGLAGRDPIFFAQLSSEENFHSQSLDLVWNTCFGCHGIMGQRQLQLDKAKDQASCEAVVFTPDIVTAIPYSGAQTTDPMSPHFDLENAKYGALARDGISCVACHRTILTPAQEDKYGDQPQNACVKARQEQLNGSAEMGGLMSFGRTFTGSFLVSDPATLFGPFEDPKTKPMAHALGNIPEHDPSIASSEQCGTCHTVHLPTLWTPENETPQIISNVYEQTTYPEWLFSAFRTGTAAFLPAGDMLPYGAGATPVSCAECHMESHAKDGTPFKSQIASIQQSSNMPEAEYVLPGKDIDLPTRSGFARHTLVGLNLFLVKMADQFHDILGIPVVDPMMGSSGVNGLDRTADMMVENALEKTARISVASFKVENETLSVDVRIDNLAGHKFPSGVSFRRAFVEFEVLGLDGKTTLWHSGATNGYGVLTDTHGTPLMGELWYDTACNKIVDQHSYQPHYETITQPDQVQIYQEVKLDPGDPAQIYGRTPSCAEDVDPEPSANLTTSFLSICHTPKDNRLQPAGLLDFGKRVEISRALGLVNHGEAEKLALETGTHGVAATDTDYIAGGGDTVTYAIPLADLPDAPGAVRATLHYQATPPFFLQDRFCTGQGANRDRLYHMAGLLDTAGTPIADWKFQMVSTGDVAVTK